MFVVNVGTVLVLVRARVVDVHVTVYTGHLRIVMVIVMVVDPAVTLPPRFVFW